ncbi:MAG: PAS domain-containing protein [Pseudohongiella sp.]|nr:PAS domain-containing protein [Pseudohongiella sp.]MDP2126777.1 PAS domain-containing protein [Pseudohongiella sp.]
MTTNPLSRETSSLLRQEAETRLREGTAPAANNSQVSVDALRLLHKLASSPATASDALKLLYELQVHQVELDLQLERQKFNELELTQDVTYYRNLFELAPIGYLVLTLDGHITEANMAALGFLETEADDAAGRRFDSFLTPKSQAAFEGLLNKLNLATFTGWMNDRKPHRFSTRCVVQTNVTTDPAELQLKARISPDRKAILLMVTKGQ